MLDVRMTKPPAQLRSTTLPFANGRYVLLSFAREGADDLTAAEREVTLAALSGLSNAGIAKQRGSSPRTVANQLALVFRKLGVHSRAELAAHARWKSTR
jgi:DNA-binding CsgD family transcriptional regulator